MSYNISDIKKKRIELNITQSDLATVAGLHQSAITRIESGKVDCRLSTIDLLDKSLEIIEQSRKNKYTGVIVTSKTDFDNVLYKSVIEELERLERAGTYQGNGHHLAQRLIERIDKEMGVK